MSIKHLDFPVLGLIRDCISLHFPFVLKIFTVIRFTQWNASFLSWNHYWHDVYHSCS